MSTHHARPVFRRRRRERVAEPAAVPQLLPLLIAAYVISFLDRTNIAFAKHSMGVDLGISSAAYGPRRGLFFLTYALFEIPSNLIMHRVGARFWITRIMITGALSVAMAFVSGETSFYVMRLLLGAAEAGLFPRDAVPDVLVRPRACARNRLFPAGRVHRKHRRRAAGRRAHRLDGTLGFHGWQWLFVVEGIPAILLAFVVWTRLPDRPSTAPWLSPETGRALERTLAAEQDAGAAHGGHAFGAALRDPQIWLAIFVYFCHQLTIYTVIFFLPGIIGASGRFSPFAVGLLTALPWLAAACGAATLPRFARESRHSRRMLCAGWS